MGFMFYQHISWDQNIRLGYQVNRAHLALMMGYSRDVPMIAPTVSRPMIYVPGYNLEQERAFYQHVQMGIYHGDLASLWLNGVSLAQIHDTCDVVSWNVSPYQGPYSHYLSFTVSGQTKEFEAAALVDDGGHVFAMAIPEVVNTVQIALGEKRRLMRGFALSDQYPFALVMLGGHDGYCKLIATDLIDKKQLVR
jgi:hypothetical protein